MGLQQTSDCKDADGPSQLAARALHPRRITALQVEQPGFATGITTMQVHVPCVTENNAADPGTILH